MNIEELQVAILEELNMAPIKNGENTYLSMKEFDDAAETYGALLGKALSYTYKGNLSVFMAETYLDAARVIFDAVETTVRPKV